MIEKSTSSHNGRGLKGQYIYALARSGGFLLVIASKALGGRK